ncbi:MAG: hypothetical protein ABI972_04360 [Acidobacteriota bacterium]
MAGKWTHYVASLPERVLRTATGLAAGLVREVGEASLPGSLRRTRLYGNLVDSTLRFLIEQVGNLDGIYEREGELANDFAIRRAAGNGIEMVGLLAFRASPVWVMAAVADLSGAGRHLIREIAASLAREGLLDPTQKFETMDDLLAGLERTSEKLADTLNTPPLDVAGLKSDWATIRREATSIPATAAVSVERLWREMNEEAAVQKRTLLEISAVMTLGALRSAPQTAARLGRSSVVAAMRTTELLDETLLAHYRETLADIHSKGFLAYWSDEFRPYLAAAARQFERSKQSLTERLLEGRGREKMRL